jgi:hypothetical protein
MEDSPKKAKKEKKIFEDVLKEIGLGKEKVNTVLKDETLLQKLSQAVEYLVNFVKQKSEDSQSQAALLAKRKEAKMKYNSLLETVEKLRKLSVHRDSSTTEKICQIGRIKVIA